MKLVILDRDGTINALGAEGYVAAPDDWTPLPGALDAIARLNHAGWHVVLATNQPGLGRGLFDMATLIAIHARMHRQLAAAGGRIDAVFFCPHTTEDGCHCREPAPGLLEQICERYNVDADAVLVAGSCPEHLQAGAALGAQLHWLGPAPAEPAWTASAQVHADLAAFADHVLRA
ncbi:D-glycero-beta-D-manno-heptose 1,7-bisphosphate 7-phosphatase [Comamonas granuli]|uniref:D-glycero-beta-D-manno-heptose 1,7-bisphosphate 7-phosphatase n=1 Tax=Comamonas granuli TaxID=290309 RepID=UPI0005A8AF12|nr:D-glycero-beta-D-manno-heptose 1,7-bisphosphate 7-phosphatase [Comamonas granuli]